MARKSRIVSENKSSIDIGSTKTPETCAGVYLRLSSKDGADKDSLHNQKAIIEGFLEAKPDIKVFKYYIETGTYLETIFPRIGVRFISVGEEIDSQDKNSKDFEIAIKSLLNHFHAQDISAKVKSVVKQKQISGEYVAARLPCGYEKSIVEGRTIYVTDPEKYEAIYK